MKKYILVFLNTVSVQMSYKFNFVTNLFNNILSVFISIFTWNAIFSSSELTVIGNLTHSQMILYTILTHMSTFVFSTGMVLKMGGLIRTGKLTTHLLRPYSLVYTFFAEFLAEKLPFILIYLLFIGWGVFQSVYSFPYLLLVVALFITNIIMFFYMMMTIGNLGFWLLHMWPLRPILNSIYIFFGGLLFPLDILPLEIYRLLVYNPFSLIAYRYTLALQSALSIREVLISIMMSIAWGVFFYIAYQISYIKGLTKYESVGG